jgi:hypothetical protein
MRARVGAEVTMKEWSSYDVHSGGGEDFLKCLLFFVFAVFCSN